MACVELLEVGHSHEFEVVIHCCRIGLFKLFGEVLEKRAPFRCRAQLWDEVSANLFTFNWDKNHAGAVSADFNIVDLHARLDVREQRAIVLVEKLDDLAVASDQLLVVKLD